MRHNMNSDDALVDLYFMIHLPTISPDNSSKQQFLKCCQDPVARVLQLKYLDERRENTKLVNQVKYCRVC